MRDHAYTDWVPEYLMWVDWTTVRCDICGVAETVDDVCLLVEKGWTTTGVTPAGAVLDTCPGCRQGAFG